MFVHTNINEKGFKNAGKFSGTSPLQARFPQVEWKQPKTGILGLSGQMIICPYSATLIDKWPARTPLFHVNKGVWA